MNKKIDSFRGPYYFLSNFYSTPITYDGLHYRNAEAAYQAQKCVDRDQKLKYMDLEPSEAKRLGRKEPLRSDWEDIKVSRMYGILTAKFEQNKALRVKLCVTGNAHLEEGNTWGDRFWGTVEGQGVNKLGHLLMQVREDLKRENELIILERENGWYSGYMIEDGEILQKFNTQPTGLFSEIRHWTDLGFVVTCLNKSYEQELLNDRMDMNASTDLNREVVIWRHVLPKIAFGAKILPIATTIKLSDFDVVKLDKDFWGVRISEEDCRETTHELSSGSLLIKGDSRAAGIYELESGGCLGATVEEANAFINSCPNRNMLERQIEESRRIRDSKTMMLSNADFGIQKG